MADERKIKVFYALKKHIFVREFELSSCVCVWCICFILYVCPRRSSGRFLVQTNRLVVRKIGFEVKLL